MDFDTSYYQQNEHVQLTEYISQEGRFEITVYGAPKSVRTTLHAGLNAFQGGL